MANQTTYVSCYVPQPVFRRIETWRKRAAADAGGPVSRSAAVRLFLFRGLEAITGPDGEGVRDDDHDDHEPTGRIGDEQGQLAAAVP